MYSIWIKIFENGKHVGSMRSCTTYIRKGNAERAAQKLYGHSNGKITYDWIVSRDNPWKTDNEEV